MICANCKKQNADSFKFCQFCGSRLNPADLDSDVEALPNSTVTDPASLDDWLMDDGNGEIDLHTLDNTKREDELPLLDTSNATLIPVESPESSDLQKLIQLDERRAAPNHPRLCRQCGQEIAAGHRFCGKCGTKYNSGYDFNPISKDEGTPSVEFSGSKRTVERINFVPTHTSATAQDAARFYLHHINDDGTTGDEIPLCEGENFIGRISSPHLNQDRFVSPKHAKITCHDDTVTLEDFGSLNGVFLRISGSSTHIFNGDIFRIGEELISFNYGPSTQAILSNRANDATTLLGGEEKPGWGYLRLILGAYSEGSVFHLCSPRIVLGRTHGDIRFSRDAFVSGTHAAIEDNGDSATLTDLDSSNGTFLRITSPVTVNDTLFFLIGNQLMRLMPREEYDNT
ncbi:MAG: FHA domain-containing protein [Bradymonadia bacterium]